MCDYRFRNGPPEAQVITQGEIGEENNGEEKIEEGGVHTNFIFWELFLVVQMNMSL